MLAVLYLIFNEGYAATSGPGHVRDDLCAEAIGLTRLLDRLMPDEPEVAGLLALMLLIRSRRPARVTVDGAVVGPSDQDRERWDQALINEGQAIVRRLVHRGQPGPYQIQASINAVHSAAASVADTDWTAILSLYDQLLAFLPTPVVALNRAVAVAEVSGPAVALDLVTALPLVAYQPAHAIRADLLRRLGRTGEAAEAYRTAMTLTGNEAERAFLARGPHQPRVPGAPLNGPVMSSVIQPP